MLFTYHVEIAPDNLVDIVTYAANRRETNRGFRRHFSQWQSQIRSVDQMVGPLIFETGRTIHFLAI
jgi:hypothetical protein